MDDLIQRLRDAEWDRDRWKAKAEELAVLEPRLLSFDGAEVRIAVAKHVSSLIADSMLTILDSVDAPNYVEMTFNRVEGDAVQEYRATFHRPGCKTPHQVKDEALAALSAAEARVKELEAIVDRMPRTRDGVLVRIGTRLYFSTQDDEYMTIDRISFGSDSETCVYSEGDDIGDPADPQTGGWSSPEAARDAEEDRHAQ